MYREAGTRPMYIMVYGSTPYVGMALKKMVATLKVHNDTLEMSALD